MCIEADILMSKAHSSVPIMAHPPHTTSDLTFDEFLSRCKTSGKVLKFDFKTQNCIETCLEKLNKIHHDIKSPIMLNADLFKSDHTDQEPSIDSYEFIRLCNLYSPKSILSIGWTTKNGLLHYTWSDVYQAYKLIKDLDVKQEITFPVKTTWSIKSIHRLNWLLSHIPNSTITLWSHENDHDDHPVEWLLLFRKFFTRNQVIYDIPHKYKTYLDTNFRFDGYEVSLKEKNDSFIKLAIPEYKLFNRIEWNSSGEVYLSDYGVIMSGKNSCLSSNKKYNLTSEKFIKFEALFEFIAPLNEKNFKINLGCFQLLFQNEMIELKIDSKSVETFKIPLRKHMKVYIELEMKQLKVSLNTYELNNEELCEFRFQIGQEHNEKFGICASLTLLANDCQIGIDKLKFLEENFILN